MLGFWVSVLGFWVLGCRVYLPLVTKEWKNGSNSSYNCTPFLHSLLTKAKSLGPCAGTCLTLIHHESGNEEFVLPTDNFLLSQ